jgi:protein TonB
MYRSDLNLRDRSGAIAAVAVIHVALILALLNASGRIDLTDAQNPIQVFDVTDEPPPPQPVEEQQRQERERPREAEGAASPENIRSRATPVVAPEPRIALPLPVPMTTTETPNVGAEPTQGAADVPGPGTGAGGTGTGTGSGGSGSGTGGGGGGGAVQPPQLVTPVLRGRDFPREMLGRWPGRTTAFLRLRVDSRGFVSECSVDRGTGVPSIDSALCNLAHDRLRFRPARDRDGRPVAGWFGYAQPAPR